MSDNGDRPVRRDGRRVRRRPPRCAGRTAKASREWTWADVRATRRPAARRRARRARHRSRRPGRAADAQPARVPRRRRRGDARAARHRSRSTTRPRPTRSSTSPGTATRVRRDRRGRRLPRAAPRGARPRCPSLRDVAVIEEPAGGLPDGVLRWDDAARGTRRSISTTPAGDRAAVRPRDGDLHVGHDRAAEGRDARPRQHRVDGRVLPRDRRRRARVGALVSYLPMAHIAERMTSHYLGIASAFEVTTCPEPGPGRQLPRRGPARRRSSPCPASGRRRTRSLRAAVDADPAKAAEFDAALDIGWEVSELRARGEEPTGELAAALRRGRTGARVRARHHRTRPGRHLRDRCRADPVRDPALLPCARAAALGDLRVVGDDRAR